MSFILDALKKSEAERQRQTGPTLLELRITHPRRRYPIWALALGGLLAVNAIVLLFVVLHRPAAPGSVTGATAAATAGAPTAASGAASGVAALPAVPVSASAGPTPATPSARLAATAQAATAQGATAQATPPPDTTENGAARTSVPPLAGSGDNPAAASATPLQNPADDAPAVMPAKPVTPADLAALPTRASLGDQVPVLQLNMLVTSNRPADRYALINMHRVREGDVLPEGARVLAITPDGVAMEYHGQDFLLPRADAPPSQ